MARPIAGINEYPYGVCGYIANGVHFHDHTKTTNLRIYKQRSDVMFDLIDPSTEIVYQKLLLTGVDVTGVFLDYSLSDSQLVNMIPRNTFFVRGYNPQHTIEGFVIRFLTNKKILSNGKVLYDMYIPECGIPPIDISNIIANPIKNGDTSITGVITVPSGTVNTNGMVITATLPDGREVTGIVNPDGSFVIDTVTPIVGPGTVTIKVTSPNYNDKSVTVPIIMDDQDSDYVTSISIPSSEQQQSGNVFVSTIPASVHGRGNDIVIQLQSLDQTDFVLYDADVSVVNGNITVTKYDDTPYRAVIIGKTLKTTPYVAPLAWTASGEKFLMNIAASEHGKKNISFTVYEGNKVVMLEVDLESDEEIILHSNIELTGKIVIVGKD
ncbi:hypothetical protein SEPL_493 [Salmonella phage SE_PL]|nr:carboxypeptidase regulatory-like domain-containing protein [Salmonella enterica]ECV9083880.1 carboxypeptidase regulatory-like domain-containing protein [Salmonella enterica subsp. enterica serovar Infantis]MCP0435523.1 carboxypeptidase-like regulatory domain-containing protein [Salmonella enterica subsp. enterica serovar Mbandaka]QCW18578.1 structural protein [Salmonella phage 7t3]QIG63106.1 hypothetical protein SEPL_493 [Salmonella phage SE_PL]